MRKGWLPTALAVFAMAGAARADAATSNPLESVIVIIGDAVPVAPPVVNSLPAMTIAGDAPRRAIASGAAHDHNALGSFVIDPETGLAVPRLRERREPMGRSRNTSLYGGPHIDPATGLMIPDFVRVTSLTSLAGRRTTIDRRTGLIRPSDRQPAAPRMVSIGDRMTIDPTTGLMVPIEFVSRRNRRAP